jgi:hypothetical protein
VHQLKISCGFVCVCARARVCVCVCAHVHARVCLCVKVGVPVYGNVNTYEVCAEEKYDPWFILLHRRKYFFKNWHK